MGKNNQLSPNSFRAIIVADLHMSNKLSYAQPIPLGRGLTDRLQEQRHLWERIHAASVEKKADALFVLGDLFDKPTVDAITLKHAVEAVMSSPVPVYLLPGNHDSNSVRAGRFTVEAFSEMGLPACGQKVNIIGDISAEQDDIAPLEFKIALGNQKSRLRFWSVAFKPLEETEAIIGKIRARMHSVDFNVLLLHASVSGSEHLNWKCEDGLDPDALCEGFDQVFSGHFHTHQRFGDCGMYVGAPMHHHFGDAGREAGYWFAEWRRGESELEFIDGDSPRFFVFDRLQNDSKEARIKAGDYVRYEIEATHPDWVKQKSAVQAFCDALKSKGIKASFKHKPLAQHEARLGEKDAVKSVKMDMDTAIGKYTEAVGVVVDGLDIKRLKRLGRDILSAARGTDGPA